MVFSQTSSMKNRNFLFLHILIVEINGFKLVDSDLPVWYSSRYISGMNIVRLVDIITRQKEVSVKKWLL